MNPAIQFIVLLCSTLTVGSVAFTVSTVTFTPRFFLNAAPPKKPADPTPTPSLADDSEPIQDRDAHLKILDCNLRRHTGGRGILEFMGLPDNDAWYEIQMSSQFALTSYGKERGLDGPVINYANYGALGAYQLSYDQITKLPVKCLANAGLDQEEWFQISQRVFEMGEAGFKDNYKGFRISTDLVPFFIRDAIVSYIWILYVIEGQLV
jgi:hypothetical protein